MNPHKKNKVDINSLSPEEQRLFRLYGKLPSKSDHFAKHLKERKYFDSGDYALSKAGKADSVDAGTVGSQHPVPENIPHLSSPVGAASGLANGLIPQLNHQGSSGAAGSPVKESSVLHRETSADADDDDDDAPANPANSAAAAAAVANKEGQQANRTEAIPIRR